MTLRKHAAALGLALVIFGAGAIVGVVVDRHFVRGFSHGEGPWPHSHAELLEAFRVHLDLTDEQTRTIADIMERTRAEAMKIHTQPSPEMRALHERAQAEVLEVLTPEQAEHYREIMKRHDPMLRHGH